MKLFKLSEELIVNLEAFNGLRETVLYLNGKEVYITPKERETLKAELNAEDEKRIRQLKNINYSLKAILTLKDEEVIEQIKKIVERIDGFIND